MTTHTLLLVFVPLFTVACASTSPLRQAPQVSEPPASQQADINRALTVVAEHTVSSVPTDYRLGPQDRLEITLFNVPIGETGVTPRTTEVQVSQEGNIALPLLGTITATGLTTTTLEDELRTRYKKYLHDPQVGVLVKEFHSQRVSVIGAVQRPGVFELTGPKTLVDLLALAGGVNDKAGTQLYLLRQGAAGPQRYIIDLRTLANGTGLLNLPVEAEDVIDVPRAGTFFVDGAVLKAGAYPLDRPYTVTQALASAGGIDETLAKSSEVTIFRHRGPTDIETVSVNMNAIRSQGAADLRIEADDVIFVPTSMPKFVVKRFLGALGMGLSVPIF